MHLSALLSIAALAGLAAASSSSTTNSSGVQVVVKNQCSYNLNVYKLTNDESSGASTSVSQGSSQSYSLPETWQGRFWARQDCSGTDCQVAASDPASLAEFAFRASNGDDFYDISFVDGFNLPMKISPMEGKGHCESPTCAELPSCPDDMKLTSNGKFIGCQSACAKYGTDEYCCLGNHNGVKECAQNSYSKVVKEGCPDAYSYAYDDSTSTYSCAAKGYTITFCP